MGTDRNYGSTEDRLFCDRIRDVVKQAAHHCTSRFTHFLDERQQALCQELLEKDALLREMLDDGMEVQLFGGHDLAQRKMLGAFSAYCPEEERQFPIQPVTFTYRKADSLSHRDFLGAFMSLSIKRELIGDILTEPGLAVVFLTEVAARVVMDEIDKVGRVGVEKTLGVPDHLPDGFTLEPIRGTVGSMRLDCVVGLVTNLSREKAAALVKSGAVSVNFFVNTQVSDSLKEGDILSIRGWGRYTVIQVGGQSKKGRLHLTCGKYQ